MTLQVPEGFHPEIDWAQVAIDMTAQNPDVPSDAVVEFFGVSMGGFVSGIYRAGERAVSCHSDAAIITL